MAIQSKPPYRRLLFHVYDKPGMMMAYWTPRAPEHSTLVALERLERLRTDATGLPNPHRCVITDKAKVPALPLRPVIPAIDSDLSPGQLQTLADSLSDTTDVLLFGAYGTFAQILRWNSQGARQADLPHDWFVSQADINVLDGTFISDDWKCMFLRRNKKSSL